MTGKPGRPREWTAQEDALLRDLYLEGKSTAYLADRFDTSRDNIRQRLSRLGVRRPSTLAGSGGPPRPRREEGGLAARVASLLGLAPEPEPAIERLDDNLVRRFVEDPAAFLTWLGVSLFDYQADALELIRGHDRTALVWSRQSGKDHLTALYALWLAVVRPGAVVVCVSPSQRQSDLWMERLQGFALSRRELRESVVDLSSSELSLTNASRVYSLPGGMSGGVTIRGFSRVSLLVFNEAAWVDESVYQAAGPFLAASEGGKVVLISTPFGQSGFLWRAWNSELYARSHVPAERCPLIAPAFLEKERASMDSLSFESEYHAAFLSSQNAYFPSELVARAVQAYPLVETPLEEHAAMTRYLGADWARVEGGDRTVLTVVGVDASGHGRVLWLKTFEGTSYVDQVAYVAWLHGLWRFRRIYSDASAHAVNDLLRAKGLPVEPVTFSLPSKVELYSRLKAALEADKLTLPQQANLLRELASFEYRISASGNLMLHAAAGGHDDFPDSLALASRTLTRERGKPGPVVFPSTWSTLGPASPRPLLERHRPPERPLVLGVCETCHQPIVSGQEYVGANARRHARCPAGLQNPGV